MGLRATAIFILLVGVFPHGSAQIATMPLLHAGDTLYLSRDMLPEKIDLAETGEDLYWEMGRLLAPFVHETLIRPDANGGFVLTGPDDIDRYLILQEDGIYLTRLGLPGGVNKDRVIAMIDPPIPYWKNAQFGDSWTYSGTFTVGPQLTGSEIRYKLGIQSVVDGAGEVNCPTARYGVLRERRDIDFTIIKGVGPDDLRLPPGFSPGRAYFFLSTAQPFPVAIVQTDGMNRAKQVEYLTHPWAGVVVRQLPQKPDIIVYPNPSFGNVRFDLLNLPSGYYDLEIYNILGMLIRTERVFANGTKTLPLDLTRLKKGTYIYRLVDSQKNTIKSKRLVIITP